LLLQMRLWVETVRPPWHPKPLRCHCYALLCLHVHFVQPRWAHMHSADAYHRLLCTSRKTCASGDPVMRPVLIVMWCSTLTAFVCGLFDCMPAAACQATWCALSACKAEGSWLCSLRRWGLLLLLATRHEPVLSNGCMHACMCACMRPGQPGQQSCAPSCTLVSQVRQGFELTC
jgi:hypothetical protein